MVGPAPRVAGDVPAAGRRIAVEQIASYSVRVRAFLLIVLLALPATAQWSRLIVEPRDELRVDKPEAHPLKYFTEFPRLRDESGEFCYLCTPDKRLAEAKNEKAKTDVRLVGTTQNFAAYDVMYYFGDDSEPTWKSILVRIGPDSYREIYHDQPAEGKPNPSFLVKAGEATLLCLRDNIYRSDAVEECFWFGTDHVERLDFAPVWQAARKAVPPERRIWAYDLNPRTNFQIMTIPVGLRSDYNGRCCTTGVVYVRFKVEGGRVLVIKADFDPDAKY